MIKIEEIATEINRVSVVLQGACNYRCHYCHVDRKRLDGVPFGRFSTREGAEKLLTTLNQIGRSSVSLIGAGEVMLLPNFIELCADITKQHKLGITTNFSRPIEPFMEAVPPDKVSSFVISLHPEGEKELELLKSSAGKMCRAGYPLTVIYVAHPLRLSNIPALYRIFTDLGILFKVAPFNGEFRGKLYPPAYTKEEKDYILPCIVDPLSRYSLNGHVRRHAGKPCAAGYSSFAVFEEDGRIQRCQNTPYLHGNVFESRFEPLSRPAPCSAQFCHCDVCLEEHLFLRKYYGKFSDRKLPTVSDETMKEYEKVCRPGRNLFLPIRCDETKVT